jgi:uncharacterized protein (DUF2252 family)
MAMPGPSPLAPPRIASLAEQLGIATKEESVTLADAAYWVKGCSSLGRPRYAILLAINGPTGRSRLAMLDLKEAPPAAAPRHDKTTMPRDNAERGVTAARMLSTALGNRMLALRLLDRPTVLRELAPQDLKIEPDHLPPGAMDQVTGYLGRVVGDAHTRLPAALPASYRSHRRLSGV